MARTTTEDTSCVKGYEYDIQGVNIFRIDYRLSKQNAKIAVQKDRLRITYQVVSNKFKLALDEARRNRTVSLYLRVTSKTNLNCS